MIRFVEGIGVMGGLGWMPGGNAAPGGDLFGMMLDDAAGSARGASQFGAKGRATERGSRDRDRLGSGIESGGGGVPPLESHDRQLGRAERPHADPATARDTPSNDRTPRGDHGTPSRDTANAQQRTESRNANADRAASREPSAGAGHATEADSAGSAKAEGQAMATNAAATSAAGVAGGSASGSAAGSSIRLIAQPGGELGITLSNASKGTAASEARQAGSAQHARAEAEAVVRAASRGINSAIAQRGGNITIRLIPETLGALRVQVEIDGGRVAVRIEATNTQAAEMLSANAASLRQSLESRGMTVERIQIVLPNAENSRVQSAQDSRGTDAERQDERDAENQHTGDGRSPDSEHRQPGDEPSDRAEQARPRSPMERFGERLRLILDGVGS